MSGLLGKSGFVRILGTPSVFVVNPGEYQVTTPIFCGGYDFVTLFIQLTKFSDTGPDTIGMLPYYCPQPLSGPYLGIQQTKFRIFFPIAQPESTAGTTVPGPASGSISIPTSFGYTDSYSAGTGADTSPSWRVFEIKRTAYTMPPLVTGTAFAGGVATFEVPTFGCNWFSGVMYKAAGTSNTRVTVSAMVVRRYG